MKIASTILSLLALTLSGAPSLAAELEANWQGAEAWRHHDRGPGHRPGRPGYPGHRPQPPRGELLSRGLQQNFQGQNTLPLRQILNIGPEYRGRRVQYVVLRASTAAGRGQAYVTVNGQAVTASQVVGTYTTDYYFQLPAYADEIGFEIQQLQMELRGNFFVTGVAVMLESNWGGGRW